MTQSNCPVPLNPDIAKWAASLNDNAREFFNERAGIREFEGGLPREEAELGAMNDVLHWLIRQR
jgi:hypothetical protein